MIRIQNKVFFSKTLLLFSIITICLVPFKYFIINSAYLYEFGLLILIIGILLNFDGKMLKVVSKFQFLVFLYISYFVFCISVNNISIIEKMKYIRVYIYPAIVLFLFNFIIRKDYIESIDKVFQIIFYIMAIDCIYSGVMSHIFHFSPISVYPWAGFNLIDSSQEGGRGIVSLGRYISFQNIPTIYDYPYPHREGLLLCIFGIYLFSSYNDKKYLYLTIIALLFLFIKTVILGLIIVLFLYLLIKGKVRIILTFLLFILIFTIIFRERIEFVLVSYGNFAISTLIKILHLKNFFKFLNEATFIELMFGNLESKSKGFLLYGTEVRILDHIVGFGFFGFFIFLSIMILPWRKMSHKISIKYRLNPKLLSFVPFLIIFDSLHYFTFYSLQNSILLILILSMVYFKSCFNKFNTIHGL